MFKERTPNSITIEVMGTKEVYELLCILDFNNIRKRMSVILRKDGKLTLYCKGADNVIYERLKSGQDEVKGRTQDHLNVTPLLVFFLSLPFTLNIVFLEIRW